MKLRVALIPSYEPDDVLLNVVDELLVNSFTVVVVNDGSGHEYDEVFSRLPEGVHYLSYEENTLVLGSRFFDKKAPFKSRFGNFMARASFLLSTRHKIYDTQTGLRAFDSNLLEKMIAIKGDRYEYEMNVLLDAVRSDITVY